VRPRAYAALTLHRPSNVDSAEALGRMVSAMARIQAEIPVVFPVHPRTRQRLADMGGRLPGLLLIDPLPYLDFVCLMAHARCVLTDSGGIQEETTALGVPCLTLRCNTERPVTLTSGTNRLVGTDPERILQGIQDVLAGNWPPGQRPPLWDGRAAVRIGDVIEGWANGLGRGSRREMSTGRRP
jgi:UDP-N-acetylglucosamine 2-epimerase (non-hydrolysing)